MRRGHSEFLRVTAYFHQDADLTHNSFQELLVDAFGVLNEREMSDLASFLRSVVGEFDDAQLQELWSMSGAELHFPTVDQLRAFLDVMRTLLDRSKH